MFRWTHRPGAPWTVVRANDKKRGRLEAMRFVLNHIDYPEKNPDLLLDPDCLIVGPPDVVAADAGESGPGANLVPAGRHNHESRDRRGGR